MIGTASSIDHLDRADNPSPVIGAFLRSWSVGLAVEDRARLVLPFVGRLPNSRGTDEQEHERSMMALRWHNGVMLPAFLDLVPALSEHAAAVRAEPLNATTVRAAWATAWAAARVAARVAAGATAGDAARDAARDALQPTITKLQHSAADLVERMFTVTETDA